MALLLLVACACPTFDEMEVVDPEGLSDAAFDAAIAAAIADFAAWTGREGVCVPGVEVVEELRRNGEQVAGRYPGPHQRIEIAAYAHDPETLTRHELCHALDEEEGHVLSRPDLFSAADFPADAIYDTAELRRKEAFAHACEARPTDVALEAAVQAACGGDRLDPVTAYLTTEVFGAAGTDVRIDEGVRVETHAVRFDREVTVIDAAGVGGELLLLLRWAEAGADVIGVSRVDQVAWEASAPLVLGVPSGIDVLAAADEPVGIVYSSAWDAATIPSFARRFDLDAGTVEVMEGVGGAGRVISAAWTSGRLVTSGWEQDGAGDWMGRIHTWPDDVSVDLPHVGRSVLPADAGVTLLVGDEITSWDGAALTTSEIPWPSEVGRARWPDGRIVLAPYIGGSPVPMLYDAGVISLPPDPCAMWMGPDAQIWADLNGAAAIMGSHGVPTGGTLPITLLMPG